MKTAILTDRPSFPLLTLTDVVASSFFQLPRWLFCDSRYKGISLEAKVAYSFLLNRFQLSRLNNWINQHGEVFIIFPRERLAQEMQVSYRKAIEAFQELAAAGLIWEKRCGRGLPNQIYLAVVRLEEKDAQAHLSAPYAEERSAKTAALTDEPSLKTAQGKARQTAETCKAGPSKGVGPAVPDLPNPQANEKDLKTTKEQFFLSSTKQANEELRLSSILENCNLDSFPPKLANLFQAAIEQLFYAESWRVKGSEIPQPIIRRTLSCLDDAALSDVQDKMAANLYTEIKSPLAYLQSMLLNAVWESEAEYQLDPDIHYIRQALAREKAQREKERREGG